MWQPGRPCGPVSHLIDAAVDLLGPVDFYRQVARALGTRDPPAAMPVDPYDAVHTLAVIDAARGSATHATVQQVSTPGHR